MNRPIKLAPEKDLWLQINVRFRWRKLLGTIKHPKSLFSVHVKAINSTSRGPMSRTPPKTQSEQRLGLTHQYSSRDWSSSSVDAVQGNMEYGADDVTTSGRSKAAAGQY